MESLKRLKKEYEYISKSNIPNIGCTVGLQEKDNYYKWKGTIVGAKDSNYQKGLFFIEIIFSEDYPYTPPEINFLTPIYHPNINPKKSHGPLGKVSPGFINWGHSSNSVCEMLTKLFGIFYWPNPDSPYSSHMGLEFKQNINLYNLKAQYFTNKYANSLNASKFDKKDWDFSCNMNDLDYFQSHHKKDKPFHYNYEEGKKIIIYFSVNGNQTKPVKCRLNEMTRKVINRYMKNYGILTNADEIIYIFDCRQLDLEIPIGENGLKMNNTITIIHDG